LAALLAGCAHAPPAAVAGGGGDAALGQVVSPDNPDRALLATAIFMETNRARLANRVPPLGRLPELDSAADEQALHMALSLHTEHSNPMPGEQTPADRVARAGFRAKRVAENAIMWPAHPPGEPDRAAYTYSALAAAIVQGWMDSPGHRANLLNPAFTYLGCAARFARTGLGYPRVFATQVFALPSGADTGQK